MRNKSSVVRANLVLVEYRAHMERELKAPTMGMEFIDWARRRAQSLSQVHHTVIKAGFRIFCAGGCNVA